VNRRALEEYRLRGLFAKKSFGQNFLADTRVAGSIARLATSEEGGTVIEVGAGLGALTEPLLTRAGRVIAVERDRDLCPILRVAFDVPILEGRLVVVEADAKTLDYPTLFAGQPEPHVLAGNLPYQITGPLIEIAVRNADRIAAAVYMVQAEVAARLIASPGSSDYGALTVFTQAAFDVQKKLVIGPGAFSPRPRVDSAVVAMTPRRPRRAMETERFRNVVHAAFAQRRKTLRNAWRHLGTRTDVEARAARVGIDLERRGETLSVEEFARFAESLGIDD
jgi:16S rRNA (adenine1518-N6/adenine1519-N6)-dimethyltransferase